MIVSANSVSSALDHNWFFQDNPEAIDKLRSAADRLLGRDGVHADRPTPFRPFGRVPGWDGGSDCPFVAEYCEIAAGVANEGEFEFPREAADYQSHRPEDKIREKLRQLEKIGVLAEIKIDDERSNLMGGDIALFREGKKRKPEEPGGLFHIAVMLDEKRFVNALPGLGVTEGHVDDSSYTKHFIGVWRPLKRA